MVSTLYLAIVSREKGREREKETREKPDDRVDASSVVRCRSFLLSSGSSICDAGAREKVWIIHSRGGGRRRRRKERRFLALVQKSRRSEIVPPSPLPTAAPNRTTRKFVPPRLLSLKAAFLVRSRGSRWCRTPRCARPSQKIVSSQKHHQSPTSSHFRRVTTGTTTTSRPPRSTTFCAKPRGVFATTRTRSLRVRT